MEGAVDRERHETARKGAPLSCDFAGIAVQADLDLGMLRLCFYGIGSRQAPDVQGQCGRALPTRGGFSRPLTPMKPVPAPLAATEARWIVQSYSPVACDLARLLAWSKAPPSSSV